jgi:hypothetical protein
MPNHTTEWTGQVTTFENGARIKTLGTTLTITTPDGQATNIDRSDPEFVSAQSSGPHPDSESCDALMNYILYHKELDENWRRVVILYAMNC